MEPEIVNSREARALVESVVNGKKKGGVRIFGGKCTYSSTRSSGTCTNYTSHGSTRCPIHSPKKELNGDSVTTCSNCYTSLTTKHRCHACGDMVCEGCSEYHLQEKIKISMGSLFGKPKERRVCIRCAALIMGVTKSKPDTSKGSLDVCFVFNVTSSMTRQVSLLEQEIGKIALELQHRHLADVHFMAAAYRDHSYGVRLVDMIPPQNDVKKFQRLLSSLHIFPEFSSSSPKSMVAGLAVAQRGCGGNWRVDAAKMIILLTDSTPHGRGYNSSPTFDEFPSGDPSGLDPLEMVKSLSRDGVTTYTLSCSPHADSVLENLARVGEGMMVSSEDQVSLPQSIATVACDAILRAICTQELARVAGETRNPTTEVKIRKDVVSRVGERLPTRIMPQFISNSSNTGIGGCQKNYLSDDVIGDYVSSMIKNPSRYTPYT